MKRSRFDTSRLGARLGVTVCVLGFVLIFFGWNGAASVDRVQSQFPYLISGGIAGLALVVVGAALIVVETSRDDRNKLRQEIAELRNALGQAGAGGPNGSRPAAPPPSAGEFVVGQHSYHRPGCPLLEGRGELERLAGAEVAERGLDACRVCEPAPVAR